MSRFLINILLISTVCSAFFLSSCRQQVTVSEMILTQNWHIRNSQEVNATGERISGSDFSPSGWVQTSMPSTVLAALIDAGVYTDPFYSDNLDKIPTEPFENPWWFRNEFTIENFNKNHEVIRLYIDGINYRANVWLNGVQIANQDTLYGAFRQWQIDITGLAQKQNVLAFEIIPPKPRDFYMGFVDWAPTPPDHYMGIYREVRLKRSGKTTMDDPFVKTDVNTATLREASVSISSDLKNYGESPKKVTIVGSIGNIEVSQDISLSPGESRTVWFKPEQFPSLNITNPRLWWPNGLGDPEMYTLHLKVLEGGQLMDEQKVDFGIRSVETYLNDSGVRGYKVNGREVLIKSGGWVDDLFLRYMPEKDAAQIRYVKEMNLNSLRFEGVWGNNHYIYDLCDRNGILLMVGWSCQWEWPDYLGLELEIADGDENLSIAEGTEIYGVKITEEEENLLSDYFRDQVKWLRNHPSIFCWAVGSDAMPKPSLEKKYQATIDKYDDTRSLLISAGEFVSELSGPSGMKMNGPYEYVPPIYWYEDKKLGGAFGFNSETGPGPQIPPIESIKKMMPSEYWWPPVNEMWDFHSGRKEFNSVGVYMEALNKKYGKPETLEELALKAQIMNYEAIRPMFEAFVVNRPTATGVVQWMLNSPWPEFYWQLYDYYLMPTGAYFGTMKACQPTTLIYNYHDHTVYASNDAMAGLQNVTAEIKIFDINSSLIYRHSEQLSLGDNEVKSLRKLPEIHGANQVYFLDLRMVDSSGKEISDNFYWLATKKDVMDWERYFWYYTPQKHYANFRKINSMDKVEIRGAKEITKQGDEWEAKVELSNPSEKIAFFIELMVVKQSDGTSVLPVFWSDNYVSLLPGQSKTLTVKWYDKDLGQDKPVIAIQGVNLKENLNL